MTEILIPNKKDFLGDWDTNWGLIYNIHIFIFTTVFLGALLSFNLIATSYIIYIIFIPNFIFLLVWSVRRSYLDVVFSKKLNVVFAVDLKDKDVNTHKIYREAIANLKSKIIENNLENIIVVREKPDDITFKSKTAAEAKITMGLPGSVLLIWGNVMETSLRFKLFFSYEFGYPGKEKEYHKKIFSQKIDKLLAQKIWAYGGPESIELLSQNFLEISYFIFGLTMASLGKFEDSVILFNNLLEEWKKLTDLVKKRNLGSAIKEAEGVLTKIYSYYATVYSLNEDYEKMKIYAEKVLRLDYDVKMNYSAYLWLAVYYEIMMDDEKKAMEYNEKALLICPPRSEHCLFNKAYFFINHHDFESAMEVYKKLSQWDHQTNYNQMRNFLFKKYERTGNLGFLFVEAFIVLIFQEDKIFGKRKLKEFIKKAKKSKDSIDYSILIKEANSLI